MLVPSRLNAVHDRAKDHRRDHHLDQGDKTVAKRLQLFAEIGIRISDRNPEGDRDQNLHIEEFCTMADDGRQDGLLE